MTIRKRIDEASALMANGFDEAALIITLVAIAAASRKAYPKSIVQFDGVAFQTYLDERLADRRVAIGGERQGKIMSISESLYKEFRCNLIHEAELPESVSLGPAAGGLTVSQKEGVLTLSREWLQLLVDVVIHDPNLRPIFDNVRRKGAHDLAYLGDEPENSFKDTFIARFSLSPGRLTILQRFIATVGVEVLGQMNQEAIRALWDEKVINSPNNFGLSEGCLSGLVHSPFASSSDATHGRITPQGLEALAVLIDNYR